MRKDILRQMVLSSVPLLWARLMLPTRLPKNWRLVEDIWNGAIYLSAEGILVRVRGVEFNQQRLFHVAVTNESSDSPLTLADVQECRDVFFSKDAGVLLELFPDDYSRPVAHLWWPMAGSPLPPLSERDEEQVCLPDRVPRADPAEPPGL